MHGTMSLKKFLFDNKLQLCLKVFLNSLSVRYYPFTILTLRNVASNVQHSRLCFGSFECVSRYGHRQYRSFLDFTQRM